MGDEELFKGYNLMLNNAQMMQDEAKLLKNNDYIARAYSLYQLSIEEVGKASIIHKAILDNYMGEKIDSKYLDNLGFRDHKLKTKESLKLELIAIIMFEKHIGKKTDLRDSLIDDYNNINKLNDLKNLSLYVSIKSETFIDPTTSISKDMLLDIEKKAIIKLKSIQGFNQSLAQIKAIAEELLKVMADPERKKDLEAKVDKLTHGEAF